MKGGTGHCQCVRLWRPMQTSMPLCLIPVIPSDVFMILILTLSSGENERCSRGRWCFCPWLNEQHTVAHCVSTQSTSSRPPVCFANRTHHCLLFRLRALCILRKAPICLQTAMSTPLFFFYPKYPLQCLSQKL